MKKKLQRGYQKNAEFYADFKKVEKLQNCYKKSEGNFQFFLFYS
jgi:hypothetical protein